MGSPYQTALPELTGWHIFCNLKKEIFNKAIASGKASTAILSSHARLSRSEELQTDAEHLFHLFYNILCRK